MIQEKRILYEHLDVPNINTFDVFRQHDGYTRFEKAIAEYQPEEIADMVKDAGLKGRGGAGFSTGENGASSQEISNHAISAVTQTKVNPVPSATATY